MSIRKGNTTLKIVTAKERRDYARGGIRTGRAVRDKRVAFDADARMAAAVTAGREGRKTKGGALRTWRHARLLYEYETQDCVAPRLFYLLDVGMLGRLSVSPR